MSRRETRGRLERRHVQIEHTCGGSDSPTLEDQRYQNSNESNAEKYRCVRQPGEDWNDREEDWDGPSQTDPRDEGYLWGSVPKGQQAQRHRHWSCDQHQRRSNYKRRCEYRSQGARGDEQAQHEEENDLAEPGKGVKRLVDDLSGTMAVTAQDETRQIDR